MIHLLGSQSRSPFSRDLPSRGQDRQGGLLARIIRNGSQSPCVLVFSFSLDISFLTSFVCRNWLGYLYYKYVPLIHGKRFITRSINKSYFFLAIYFFVGDFAIFFFCELFQVDQGCLTFERLDLLVSFHLPSKSELQLPGASLLLHSDLFKSYRIIFRL